MFDIPVTVTLDARGYLAWTLLGIILFFFDHYYIISGEVIGFRLFRVTGLAFAIRPKDGDSKFSSVFGLDFIVFFFSLIIILL